MKETREKSAKTPPAKSASPNSSCATATNRSSPRAMKTRDMLPICGALDAAGFGRSEVWGGATFDACVRYLREDRGSASRNCGARSPTAACKCCCAGKTCSAIAIIPTMSSPLRSLRRQKRDRCFSRFDALNDFSNMRAALAAVKKTTATRKGRFATRQARCIAFPLRALGRKIRRRRLRFAGDQRYGRDYDSRRLRRFGRRHQSARRVAVAYSQPFLFRLVGDVHVARR